MVILSVTKEWTTLPVKVTLFLYSSPECLAVLVSFVIGAGSDLRLFNKLKKFIIMFSSFHYIYPAVIEKTVAWVRF